MTGSASGAMSRSALKDGQRGRDAWGLSQQPARPGRYCCGRLPPTPWRSRSPSRSRPRRGRTSGLRHLRCCGGVTTRALVGEVRRATSAARLSDEARAASYPVDVSVHRIALVARQRSPRLRPICASRRAACCVRPPARLEPPASSGWKCPRPWMNVKGICGTGSAYRGRAPANPATWGLTAFRRSASRGLPLNRGPRASAGQPGGSCFVHVVRLARRPAPRLQVLHPDGRQSPDSRAPR